MFISVTHLTIAAIIVLLFIVLAFFIGCTAAVGGMESQILNAARTGEAMRVRHQPYKVLTANSYALLSKLAHKNDAWSWEYTNGKQR